jgi:outer membrane lipopolysaccharide assembly protein LptE/RlpB
MNYTIASQVIKWLALSLALVALVACATPLDKARLQADKDWAVPIASAEKYQQLQRLMFQGLPPAPAQLAAAPQSTQPVLTLEEHRRLEIEQREKIYADEWRLLEHDFAKRVLERGF